MSNLLKKAFITSAILLSSNAVYARYDSGLFMRMDMGYGMSEKFKATSASGLGPYSGFALKNSNKGVVWGAAMGFHYSSEIAFDINYTTFTANKATLSGKSNEYKLTAHGIMLNATYYIDAHFKFRPFVYVGMGCAKSRYEHKPGQFPSATAPYPKVYTLNNRTGAAYNLGLGFAMPLSHSVSVEAKYRYHYLSGKAGGRDNGQRNFGHSAIASAKINFQ